MEEEKSIHHIVCGAFYYNLIEQVLLTSSSSSSSSSSLINLNNKQILKKLWIKKLNLQNNLQFISSSSSSSSFSSSSSSSISSNKQQEQQQQENQENQEISKIIKRKKHFRLNEKCEEFYHPAGLYFGKPEKFMKRPIIEFSSEGAQLEYILMKKNKINPNSSQISNQIMNNNNNNNNSAKDNNKKKEEEEEVCDILKTQYCIIGTQCSIPFRGCCVYLKEYKSTSNGIVEGNYCGLYRITQIVNMPTVHMTISQTLQSNNNSVSIIPSLSCYATPINSSNSNNIHNRRKFQKKKKKKGLIDQIIVNVRNIHGDEISDIIWPTTFAPFINSIENNEDLLNYTNLSNSYNIPSTIQLNNISFLIISPKYELNYSTYLNQLNEIDIQKILHKYRIQYKMEDILIETQSESQTLMTKNSNLSKSMNNQIDIQEDIDFHEADRLASLISINYSEYDDDDDNLNVNLSVDEVINNFDNDNNNSSSKNNNNKNENSLDNLLFELSSKLNYLNPSLLENNNLDENDDILFGNESFDQEMKDNYSTTNINFNNISQTNNKLHGNFFPYLALQIYLAEMEAEDYFIQLTSFPLCSSDIIFINSEKDKKFNQQNQNLENEKGYELTNELITPPNQLIGKYERDIRLQEEIKIKLHHVVLKIENVDMIAKECTLILHLPESLRS